MIGDPTIEIASNDLEEIKEWKREIEAVCMTAASQQQYQHYLEMILKAKADNAGRAMEMSDLVIYCQHVPFQLEGELFIRDNHDSAMYSNVEL